MPELADFHFLRPVWLTALLPLLALPWFLARRHLDSCDWSRFVDPALLPHLLTQAPARSLRLQQVFLFMGGLLAILALAGPTLQRLPTPAFRNIQALIIVLDLSPVMDATDFRPNRLERARYKIMNLLQRHRDGQHALIVYGGEAFTVTPLTDDTSTITAQMNALSTHLLPVPGQRADKGLELADQLLKQAGITRGDVLLVTAGGLEPLAPDAANTLVRAGHRVSVLGTGTATGAPIPLAEGGFYQNAKGEIVIARMDTAGLTALAAQGGGIYRDMSDDESDIEALLAGLSGHVQIENQEAGTTTSVDQWQELGSWLLLPLLPLAAVAFRRGWLGVWLVGLMVLHPEPASALDWESLWQTADQRGQQALRTGQPAEAAQLFAHPEWKAAAEYQAGHYAESAKLLEGKDTAPSRYNLGNALAQRGQYAEALKAYERALALQPDDADAKYNRDLVKKALDEQQQSKNQQPPQSGQQKPEESSGQQSESKPNSSDSDNKTQKDDSAKSGNQQEQSNGAQQPDAPDSNDTDTAQANQAPAPESSQNAAETTSQAENRQADEQWLRRIPDDPGGLLRRKFYYQYQQRLQERQ